MKTKTEQVFEPLQYGSVKPIAGVTTIKGFYIQPAHNGHDIGEVYVTSSQDRGTQEGYARLFSASPGLLEACESCLHLAELYKDQPRLDGLVANALSQMVHLLKPRIAKARTGKAVRP